MLLVPMFRQFGGEMLRAALELASVHNTIDHLSLQQGESSFCIQTSYFRERIWWGGGGTTVCGAEDNAGKWQQIRVMNSSGAGWTHRQMRRATPS